MTKCAASTETDYERRLPSCVQHACAIGIFEGWRLFGLFW
jgi:hypothetical protein